MSALENRIPPPTVVVIVGGLMWLVAQITPRWEVAASLHFGLAMATFVVAVLIGGSGLLAFGQARTTIDPVNLQAAYALVTRGIFGYSRNPMYLGFTGLLISWAILLAAPWTLAGAPAFVAFIWRFQIVPEERVLRAKFGLAYEDYQRRVRRWL